MLYESRVYYTVPGRLAALNARFADHTMGFFRKHGIGMLGFWTDEIGISNRLTYILTFDSMADRETKWAAFQADPRTGSGCARRPRPTTPSWRRWSTVSCA